MTADFQREYGLRLIDAVRDRTEDEVLDLIFWIKDGSAAEAVRDSNGDKTKARAGFGWSVGEELSLALVNLVSHQTYALTQIHSQKKLKVPVPIPGPNGKKPSKGQDASAMAQAFLAAQKGGP